MALRDVDGVGSAREVDRLCASHDAYRWRRGGVSVNYDTVSDFRVAHHAALDGLLTQSIAVLLHSGVVTRRAWPWTAPACAAAPAPGRFDARRRCTSV